MKVRVLGTGCARCDNLYSNTVDAVARIESIAKSTNVEKVVDPEEFFRLNVAVTPALVIEDEVICSGKVLSTDQIETELLRRSSGEEQ